MAKLHCLLLMSNLRRNEVGTMMHYDEKTKLLYYNAFKQNNELKLNLEHSIRFFVNPNIFMKA